MNAKWLEKLIAYRGTKNAEQTIFLLMREKIVRQQHLLDEYSKIYDFNEQTFLLNFEYKNIFLIEAKWAKDYWRGYASLLPKWIFWEGRKPGSRDIVNRFLDIGYHYITQYLIKRMNTLDISSEVGLLHKAQSKNSHPLAYDLVELLRPLVDKVLLTTLRQKKKSMQEISQKDIKIFLFRIKKEFQKFYFNKNRKACITFSYWIDLYLLSFRKSVSQNKDFVFNFPPFRHDMRCSKQNKKPTLK